MNTTFLKQLKSHLPEQTWSWVISALRQDELVWETLQSNDSFLQAPMDDDNQPESWNPARVAFLTLQHPIPLPNASLSLGLRQRAFRTYEIVTQHYSKNICAETQPMVQAALLAVALRERLRLTGKWDKLTDELVLAPYETWRTPLACLYGLIEKPLELLGALLNPCAPSDLYHLAVHALLSNPLPAEKKAEQLHILIKSLPITDRNKILKLLTITCPWLAAELARQINFSTQSGLNNTPLDDLVTNLHHAEIALIAGNHSQAAYSINTAQENARHVQASLAAKSAQVSENGLISWQKAFELAPEDPTYRAGLALAYLENQNTIEANAILDPSEIKDQPELLYVSARLAHSSGDAERARQLATRALENIETSDKNHFALQNNIPALAEKLGRTFLLLNLPLAAVRAAQIAIRERPNDPEQLTLLGQAQSIAGMHAQAAESYQWAVLLDPQQNHLHRELAKCLEAGEKWNLALEERKIMAAAPNSTIADQYALADCALHNNQSAYAAEICRQILLNDPNDGLAHALLGEALASVGDLAAAQAHFTQASELAPSLPRPWLSLANVYKICNQPQKALDTLRIASQAIPGSHEIHQELGEYYLASNAPTQALEAFQRAAEIDPRNIPIALRLSQTLYQLGHLPQAHQVLQQAYQQEPSNTEVASNYARILMEQGDPQAALPALETVIAVNTNDPVPFVDYARALLLTHGEAAKATQALQHVLTLAPDHMEAQALIGESLASEKKYADSLQAYQTALETPLAADEEWRARLSYGLGSVALQLGQTEIAITSLLEAVHLDPENYRPHCQLAEAYQTAGLIPDAYQAAFEALRLAGDEIHVMIWYVEKTLEFAGKRQTQADGVIQQHPRHEELHFNALQVLTRAAEITPAQADLIIRIAGIQCEAGDCASAISNLRRIATIQTATPVELQQAAKMLIDLNDAAGAVACFDSALTNTNDGPENSTFRISLLSQLAQAHQKANHPEAALTTIEMAINLSPDDSGLCCEKAQLLLNLGQPKMALNFLEQTISRLPDPRLYHRASIILQIDGKLLDALGYAESGIQVPVQHDMSGYESGHLECVIQAAELARALLQPERALRILKDQTGSIKSQNQSALVNFYLEYAEIALENGMEIEAAHYLNTAMQDGGINSLRMQILQARFTARRGDYATALSTYQATLRSLGENETGNLSPSKPSDDVVSVSSTAIFPLPDTLPSILYSLTEAAIELKFWAVALKLAQKAVQLAPLEPLTHLNLAQVLVHRAEFQHLCNDSDLVGHAPGPVALSEGTCRAFDQAIQEALKICEGISQRSQAPAIPPALAHWQIRGNAVFTPNPETVQALSNRAEKSDIPDDIAASLAVIRRMSIGDDQQIAFNSQQSGGVLTQIALSLAEKRPEDAIKALQLAILNEPIRDSHNAIRHYLLARLLHLLNHSSSSNAIQTAITILPDEPRWYALAAKITVVSGDKAVAINFLEKAIMLEPRNIDHHLDLGKLYLQYAGESNTTDALQAVKSFEHACRLAPEHPEAWLLLARAHRIIGNLEQAAAAAEQSTTLAPEIAASHYVQAEIALQSGKPQLAHDHAQTALHLEPESHQSAMILSRALQALNRPAEALAVIDKVIPVSEQSTSLTIERIQLLRQSKRPEIALQAASEFADLHPDEPAVLAVLAEVQADAGQEETAIRTAQKAILLGDGLPISEQANLRLLLGKLLRSAGQLDQAIHHLDEVVRLAPEKIDALLELGRTHQDRRQQAQALQMYQRAAKIAPCDPRPYLQAGLALKEGKDYLESESMLRRAADLAPNDTTIRRQLAGVIAINLVHNPRRSLQNETL